MRKLKKIHVNQFVIKDCLKNNVEKPAFTIKHSGKNTYAYDWIVEGSVTSHGYKNGEKMACGARVWLETYDKIILLDQNKNVIGEIE